jgi:transcriptional regulator with XRE-family HTH domain
MRDEIHAPRPQDPPWRSRHAHRNLPRDVAELLRAARDSHGWTISEASRRTGVSRRMITLLERGERYPSTVLADALIEGYELGQRNAWRLRDIALPNVGRASPYRTDTIQAALAEIDGDPLDW